jgi:hypothetical protein
MYIVESLFAELEPQYRTRVYFALGVNGQIKIGLTGRQNGHRGGEMHFTELCSVPGDRMVERRYHAKYAAERHGRSEWFKPSDRLLMDVLTMCVQQGRHKSTEALKETILSRLRQAVAA